MYLHFCLGVQNGIDLPICVKDSFQISATTNNVAKDYGFIYPTHLTIAKGILKAEKPLKLVQKEIINYMKSPKMMKRLCLHILDSHPKILTFTPKHLKMISKKMNFLI